MLGNTEKFKEFLLQNSSQNEKRQTVDKLNSVVVEYVRIWFIPSNVFHISTKLCDLNSFYLITSLDEPETFNLDSFQCSVEYDWDASDWKPFSVDLTNARDVIGHYTTLLDNLWNEFKGNVPPLIVWTHLEGEVDRPWILGVGGIIDGQNGQLKRKVYDIRSIGSVIDGKMLWNIVPEFSKVECVSVVACYSIVQAYSSQVCNESMINLVVEWEGVGQVLEKPKQASKALLEIRFNLCDDGVDLLDSACDVMHQVDALATLQKACESGLYGMDWKKSDREGMSKRVDEFISGDFSNFFSLKPNSAFNNDRSLDFTDFLFLFCIQSNSRQDLLEGLARVFDAVECRDLIVQVAETNTTKLGLLLKEWNGLVEESDKVLHALDNWMEVELEKNIFEIGMEKLKCDARWVLSEMHVDRNVQNAFIENVEFLSMWPLLVSKVKFLRSHLTGPILCVRDQFIKELLECITRGEDICFCRVDLDVSDKIFNWISTVTTM